jgi:prepilin-type N-terminal cleavage/methylation domain-containing protein
MNSKIAQQATLSRKQRGFTLVELSIVLIIIGIILGAVIKGKDLIRSGEQKKLYNAWIKEWVVTYNNYYDRTGWILGDDASDTNATRDGNIDNAVTQANILAQLAAVGLEGPSDGPTGNKFQRRYSASNGNQYSLELSFRSNMGYGNSIVVMSDHNNNGNHTAGLPNDLAIALDRIIDGTTDGTNGDFVFEQSPNNGAVNNAAWPSAANNPLNNDAAVHRLSL